VNLGGWLLLEPGPSAPLSPGCSAGLGRLVNALDAAVLRDFANKYRICAYLYLFMFLRIIGNLPPAATSCHTSRLCRDTGRCEWDLMETLRRRQVHGLGVVMSMRVLAWCETATTTLVGCLRDDRIIKSKLW
jgi:hypothetical protein